MGRTLEKRKELRGGGGGDGPIHVVAAITSWRLLPPTPQHPLSTLSPYASHPFEPAVSSSRSIRMFVCLLFTPEDQHKPGLNR